MSRQSRGLCKGQVGCAIVRGEYPLVELNVEMLGVVASGRTGCGGREQCHECGTLVVDRAQWSPRRVVGGVGLELLLVVVQRC